MNICQGYKGINFNIGGVLTLTGINICDKIDCFMNRLIDLSMNVDI